MSVRLRSNNASAMVDTAATSFADDAAAIPVSPPVAPAVDAPVVDPLDDVNIPIPPRFFLGSDLKTDLSSYQVRRKKLKNKKAELYLENELKKVMKLYSADTDKYDLQLVREVMQLVEYFMIHDDKLGESKKAIVMHVCKHFFDDNEELLSSIVEYHMKTLVQSNFMRRLFARVQIFFFKE